MPLGNKIGRWRYSNQTTSHRHSQGFTLVELLIVIAIVGILSSVILISLSSAKARAKDAKVKAEIHQIKLVLETYASTNAGYPGPGRDSVNNLPFWCIGATDCMIAGQTFSNSTDEWEGLGITAFVPFAPDSHDFARNFATALLPPFLKNDIFLDSSNRMNKGYIYVSCINPDPDKHTCPLNPSNPDDKVYLIYPQTKDVKAMQVGTYDEMTCNEALFPQCSDAVKTCIDWDYGAWSACSAVGIRTRSATKSPANCVGDPVVPKDDTQSCTPPNTCSGTLNCSGDQNSCLLVQGCAWVLGAGTCSGTPNQSQCDGTNFADCTYKPGCEWGGGSSASCTLPPQTTLVSCSSRTEASLCTTINGCSWGGAGCSGSYSTSANCSIFDGAGSSACTENSGCTYNPGTNDCGLLDQQACSTTSGCTENLFDCSVLSDEGDNGANCNNYSYLGCSYDSSGTCSGTPYSGCSGTYGSGTCTGTYSQQTSCSGFNQSACESTSGCTYTSDSCYGTSTCVGGTQANCSATGCTYTPPVDDSCSGTPTCTGNETSCSHVSGCSWMQDADGCKAQSGRSCANFSNTTFEECTIGGQDPGTGDFKSTGCNWTE